MPSSDHDNRRPRAPAKPRRRATPAGRLNLLFGKIAVELRYLTSAQLRRCIRLQHQHPERLPLGEVCRREGLFDAGALRHILEEQRERLAASPRIGRHRLGHGLRRGHASSHQGEAPAPTCDTFETKRGLPATPPKAPEERNDVSARDTTERDKDLPTGPQLAIGNSMSGVWGPFEIRSVLGRGGMGAVYLAKNMLLRRLVAVKVPFESGCTTEEHARFLTEARSAACLDHPNVIRIYSVGEVQGLPYIEMEYAPGRSLDRLIADGTLEPWQAIEIFVRVCRGVAAAHGAGVIHRDLKPENILCCDDSRVLVTDFGLARNTRGTMGPEESNAVMGTVGFIAPELLKGQQPDERSDLYSLGALLFNILTGKMPFAGDLPMQVFVAQISQSAPPLLSVAPTLPVWLEGIVARLLARSPSARYSNVDALLRKMNRA